MKKILCLIFCSIMLVGCNASKDDTAKTEPSSLDILTLFSSKSSAPNKAWVGTFQLVWNDVKNNIVKNNIEFVNEEPTQELIGLNSEEFNSKMLNEASYYTSYGKTSPLAKEKIKKDILKKFDEESDILDQLDWAEGNGKYYAYAMLKKEFEFYEKFDKLGEFAFNNKGEFEYFGVNENSKDVLDNNLKVLFYENENHYAIQLLTVNGDVVYLYRTDDNSPFNKIYESMLDKAKKYEGNREFAAIDTLKVPNLKIDAKRNYPELVNKQIKGTDLYFSEAIETLQLELDNEGGKVKSEAALMMKQCSLETFSPKDKPRNFNFDKTFVMFLIDSGKENPYFALRVKDLNGLQD